MSDEPADDGRAEPVNRPATSTELMAVSSNYKVLGELTAADGIGVLGQNNAGSGTPIGVQGVVPNATDGYGLYTPDDAKVEGTIETTTIDTSGSDFTVETGTSTTTDAANVVHGHLSNAVVDSAVGATIGGGGFDDGTTNNANNIYDNYSTISGGRDNQAGTTDSDPTTAEHATVGGGERNTASGREATVGGGEDNDATARAATVAGGANNTSSGQFGAVGGGAGNDAAGDHATVSGGYSSTASGNAATVPGGSDNVADGHFSFAAGRLANTNGYDGTFVWSDSGSSTFSSTAADQFLVDAAGGMGVGTDSPTAQLDVNGDATVSGSQSIGKTSLVVFLSTNQTISGGRTRTRVEFDTVGTDHFNGWDGTNFEYEIQEPGDYHVHCHLNWDTTFTAEEFTELWVTHNGTDTIKTQAAAYYTLAGTKTFTGLSTGDTIAADIAQSSSSSQELNGREEAAFLNITKIG